MKHLISLALCCFLAVPLTSLAADPTEKDAIAMVDKAVAFAKANGKDKLIAEVNAKNAEFIQGELYVVVYGLDGVRLAHPVNPKLVGKSVLDIADVDGKEYGKEMVEVAKGKGKGWVDYKFKNPTNGKVEPKSSYVARTGDVFVIAGIYK
ncbi:cache domain-containing protein [Niveibacterium sp. 24ML]|uniref:cache domain-containing protein n=1 Tax=Niveibacterium sp. 24ML TaxID=2985512 RepID=UPI00227229B8|nr:cache domain-containing protein [Niveibacterium sp. 24ML]MCX9157565.1 cache domain-containing protein [Niveibacterium sp. 24ML]